MTSAYTVVMPAFNAERWLREALDSVLTQSCPPSSIIVVDDGSTDSTAALAAGIDARIRVIRQDNQGCGPATSRGLEEVTTEIVAFLDADDTWLPGKAAAQLDRLGRNAGLDGVFAHGRLVPDADLPSDREIVRPIWGRSTLMVRTARVREVGAIVDPEGGHGDMVDWIARARDLGLRFEMLGEVFAIRRLHTQSLTFGKSSKDRGYLVAAKAALDRRRQSIGQ